MQEIPIRFRLIAMLVTGTLVTAPFAALAEEAAESGQAPPSEAAASEAAVEDEEAARLREALEQREAEQAQARQQNCEQARTTLASVVDMPPRNVRQTQEDGTITRMTEEEHKAYIEDLRRVEAENCD